MARFFCILLSFFFLMACSHFPQVFESFAGDSMDEKMAKLEAEIDLLQAELRQQKAKIHLLEEGITYGILPSEGQGNRDEEKPEPVVKPEEPNLKAKLEQGRKFFENGAYGEAIVLFDGIMAGGSPSLHKGEPLYWSARSWLKLGEAKKASKILEEFISGYSDSPFLVEAFFYRAISKRDLGLRFEAQAELQNILTMYKDPSLQKKAKMLLTEIEASL